MTKKSFLKGSIWNTLGSAMYGANSFLMLALVSREGTVEEAGWFGIAFTTAQLLYIVGLLGINHYQQTDYGEKYSFSVYKWAKAFSTVLMAAGCGISIGCLHFSGVKAIYTMLLTVLMALNSIGELYQSLFFQKNRLDLSGGALFFRTFWSLLAFSAVVLLSGSILSGIIVQIVVNLAATIYYALRYTGGILEGDDGNGRSNIATREACKLIVECLPLFFSVFFMNVVLNSSKYGIEILLDDKAQGYYNMIFFPAQVINLCSQFLFKPMLSSYAESLMEAKGRYDRFGRLIMRQIGIVVGFTVVGCIISWWIGTPLMGIIYDKDITAMRMPLLLIVFGGGTFALCQLLYFPSVWYKTTVF